MVVVDPVLTRLIQGAVLLVIHLKETVAGAGAGRTLHVTVAGVGDHTHHTKAVGGPTLVPVPLTADHQLIDAAQIITTGGTDALLDLTPQKMVTTGGADSILGLIAQKIVTTGGTDTTRGTILLNTELHTGATEIIHLSTGQAGAEADVTGLFLEVCLLPQGDITGATLLADPQLGLGEAFHPGQKARGGATHQVSPQLGQQVLLIVTVLLQGAIQVVTVAV